MADFYHHIAAFHLNRHSPQSAAARRGWGVSRSFINHQSPLDHFGKPRHLDLVALPRNSDRIRRLACLIAMSGLKFLLISLGNQAPYYDTFHSAGHHVLNALQAQLGPGQPSFTSTRVGKKASLASLGSKYMMVQSPTFMNTSGPWVSATWKQVLEDHDPRNLALVLVHDELEEALGVVKTRQWSRSHRGHNGIKSVNASLKPTDYPDSLWSRIGVGIGRPEGRDHRSVSDYVLGPMSKYQKTIIEGKGAEGVLRCLDELERKWQAQNGTTP